MTRDRIKVEQTLHGYSEGHRIIEGSVKLPQADARTMLVLSDASGSGGGIPTEGYLTGYPLSETGKYVIARTWAAPEMSRPGCVWTHSLLVDFSDLARLTSGSEFAERFVRPASRSPSEFGRTIEIDVARTPAAVTGRDLQRVGQWIGALYGRPKSRIIAEREGRADDELVLAIWMQQWPRLRRAFRYCTFSADDRSTSADVFDLQLVDGGRSSRSRIPDGILASSVEGGEWMDILLRDLAQPAGSGLRKFLRDVGADVSNGRTAMAPLTQLFAAVEPSASPMRIAEAIHELERLGPSQGRMGRAAAARTVLSRPDLGDSSLFEFALDQIQSNRDLLGVDPALVGGALLRWRPDLLGVAIADNDPLLRAVDAALPLAEAGELETVVGNVPEAAARLLSARPDILARASFWGIPSIDAPRLIGSLNLKADQVIPIVAALVEAGRNDCSTLAVDRFGVEPVVTAFSGLDAAGIRMKLPWLRSIAWKTDGLAECMVSGALSHRPLLIALAAIVDPDGVPNNAARDPWVIAVEQTRTSGDVHGEDLLAAFLFNRARGRQSKSPGRLFFLSVQRLHEAMAASRLSSDAWAIASRRLPWGSLFREWDPCEKLRHAVVNDFIDRDLPPIEFGTVVDDGNLWWTFVKLAADTSRGKRYLGRVRKALRDGDESWWRERSKLIESKIG
ncbi:MAG TPA: hypothetical protein VGC56_07155 [Allosphingosinicella sp.]